MSQATTQDHDHRHDPNRFAVVPTPVRLGVDPRFTGKGVTIAVIDSGFYPHPDLTRPSNRIVAYEDITQPGARLDEDKPPESWAWHGTQTSVVAAGNGFLSDGVYRGIASDASVVLVKASEKGKITEENIARAIRWVINHKDQYDIRIISISLGGDEDVPYRHDIVDQAAEEAISKGLIVVAAAGNSGCSDNHQPVPPANSPSVITVGGFSDRNQLDPGQVDLYCSSYGTTADGFIKPEIIAPAMWVAAPILPHTVAYERAEALSQLAAMPDYQLRAAVLTGGGDDRAESKAASKAWDKAELPPALAHENPAAIRSAIESALRDSKIVAAHYQHVDGTSFAAPTVASVAAQMIEANPDLSPAAVKHILIATADRIAGAPALRQGYGVVNAARAVEMAIREQHVGVSQNLLCPRFQGANLVFTLHDDSARQVFLAGDFNAWDATSTPLIKGDDGTWSASVASPGPGRHRYKFVVDGKWIDDPGHGLKEPDEFGGFNSIVNLG